MIKGLEQYIVHCPTEDSVRVLCSILNEMPNTSVVWASDEEFKVEKSRWDFYEEDTCYNIYKCENGKFDYYLMFADRSYYRLRQPQKKIITVDELRKIVFPIIKVSNFEFSKYIVECPTKKEAELFFECLQKLTNVKIGWFTNSSMKNTNWDFYKEKTCYDICQNGFQWSSHDYDLTYCEKSFYEQNYKGHKTFISVYDFIDLFNKISEEKIEKTLDKQDNLCYNDNIKTKETQKPKIEKERTNMCKKNYTPVTEVIDFTYKAVKQPFTEVGRIIDKNDIEPQDYSTSKAFMIGEKKERVIYTGNQTICIINHKIGGKNKQFKGIATCCRKDKFDKIKGIKIAYLRAKIDSLVEELEYLMNE